MECPAQVRGLRQEIPAAKVSKGKSVLASVIIEHCLARYNLGQQPEYVVAFFYCTNSNTQTTTCIAVIRGLIGQLLLHQPDLIPHFYEKLTKSGDTVLTSMQQARSFFELLCDASTRVALVIDGLDECTPAERKALLDYVISRVEVAESTVSGKLRVLFVSQQEGDIRSRLSSATVLTVGHDNNHEDISKYVEHRMIPIERKFELEPAMKDRVGLWICSNAAGRYIWPAKELPNVSPGMFLLAKLILDNLLEQPTKELFNEELVDGVFPEDLKGA
jgi:hypothetical protein